jgi:hypothetical protein
MGFEVFGMLVAGSAMGALVFYMIKFVVEVVMGKYRTGYEEKKK